MKTTLFAATTVLLCAFATDHPADAAPPAPAAATVTTVAFNVLAPCWADPNLYPPSAWPYLDRYKRRAVIMSFLNSVKTNTDIIALQETTQIEFDYFKSQLKQDYVAFQATHDATYWENWITPVPPYEPNGVAVFLKKSSFTNVSFADVPLTADGNHAAYFRATQVGGGGRVVRGFSVHLDSDHAYNRNAEMDAAIAYLGPASGSVDVLAGDFNASTSSGNLQQSLTQNGYVDVLGSLGLEELTSPYSSTYYGSRNWGIIDHVVVRSATPTTGTVFDFGLFTEFPASTTVVEAARITANFWRGSGSDHFPITGVARVR